MPRTKSSGPSARKSKKAESATPAPEPVQDAAPASVESVTVQDESNTVVEEWSMSNDF